MRTSTKPIESLYILRMLWSSNRRIAQISMLNHVGHNLLSQVQRKRFLKAARDSHNRSTDTDTHPLENCSAFKFGMGNKW